LANGLSVTDWNQPSAIGNLTVNAFASQIPSSLASSLGVAPRDLVVALYNLGPSPSNATLVSFVQPLILSGFSSGFSPQGLGFTVADLVGNATALGPSPDPRAVWDTAARFFVAGTASAFSGSPLFTINSSSLYSLLSGLSTTSTPAQIDAALNSVTANLSVSDYPFTLARALTQNFVGSKNDTMVVALGFSSPLDSSAVIRLKNDVKSSQLSALAST
jgi:hypothetical protein